MAPLLLISPPPMVGNRTVCILLECFLVIHTFLSAMASFIEFMSSTRMHSSRMRTARWLALSPSMHCSRGVYLPRWVCLPGGGVGGLVYLPRGVRCWEGVPAWGCTLPAGVPAWGCTCPWGVPAQGVYLPRGCTYPGRVYLPRRVPVQVLPLCTEFLTHATEILPCPNFVVDCKN